MSHARPGLTTCSQYDAALHALSAARQRWAETSVNRRLALLRQIKDALAGDRQSTRLNSSHLKLPRMPSSA